VPYRAFTILASVALIGGVVFAPLSASADDTTTPSSTTINSPATYAHTVSASSRPTTAPGSSHKSTTEAGDSPSLTVAIVPIGLGLFLIMLIGGGAFFYRRRGGLE
jgi:guanyl-specific ribonuclease Sa